MSQTNFPSIPAAFKQTIVTCPPNTTVELAALNSFRPNIVITNIGTTDLYVNYGTVCSDVIYICKLGPDAFLSDDFGGVMSGYSDDGLGYALVTQKE